MTPPDPVRPAEDKSSELKKSGANIRRLQRPGAAFQQAETTSDQEIPHEDLSTHLRQISKISISEISQLINELQTLQRRLETEGDRIQRDIEAYVGLSQQVMQITTIIADTVKKLPTSPGISP
jgi:hypothetical protein